MINLKFEAIKNEDFKSIQEIYNYYIENTTNTFHLNKISIEDLKEFIPINHSKYKSFLIYDKDKDNLCGYCYLSQYKKRQAYDRTAEITVYLKPEYQRRGIGTHAIRYLEEVAQENGISVLLSFISGENISSAKLFKNLGYTKCAHFKEVGEKFGKVIDVVGYQKSF